MKTASLFETALKLRAADLHLQTGRGGRRCCGGFRGSVR